MQEKILQNWLICCHDTGSCRACNWQSDPDWIHYGFFRDNLSSEESIKVNDLLTLRRMERYFESVDKKTVLNINNLRGWYNRAQSYHSQPKVFEKLYKDKVDYYNPHYYNKR